MDLVPPLDISHWSSNKPNVPVLIGLAIRSDWILPRHNVRQQESLKEIDVRYKLRERSMMTL